MAFSDVRDDPIPLLTAITAALVITACVLHTPKKLLSKFFHILLHYTNRVRSVDGTFTLDGPKYVWPYGNTKQQFYDAHKHSQLWSEQYGQIYRIWSGLSPEVVITTPADVAKFYSDASHHIRVFGQRAGWVFHQVLGEGIGFIDHGDWRRVRKCMDPLMANGVATKQLPQINQSAQEFVDRLGNDQVTVICAINAVMNFPLLETSRALFGDMNEVEQTELLAIGEKYMKIIRSFFADGPFCRGFRYWRPASKLRSTTREYLHRWDTFHRNLVHSRRDQPELPIMKLWKRVEEGIITRNELLQSITESTYTNIDITAHVIVTTCVLVTTDENTQKDLEIEIKSQRHDQDRYIGRTDTLLHFVLLEALRLQPAVPFTLSEAANIDKELGGFRVPQGTSVTTDTFAINVRNPFWGPDRTQYRPLRFQGLTAGELMHNLHTFGYGSRKCLGKHFAEKQLRALIMHLFHQYDVRWCNRAETTSSEFDDDRSASICVPDVKLSLTRRR
ncbi:hypothetical protein PMG11_07017 [Penicillium brasilianum]|uniref:Cytochrome P450 n=1 Tax=Penicillium brasilianum TaxID=104259 RepID=A0A0F7TNK1_PENBI|nr:hypothetical protein PMG11_07017 [Penicillium brasilianum]